MHRINIGAIVSRLDCLHRILVKLDVDQDIPVNLLVVLLNKPDEDWYWHVEISYTQTFSRCLISSCSSPFDFHFYFYRF